MSGKSWKKEFYWDKKLDLKSLSGEELIKLSIRKYEGFMSSAIKAHKLVIDNHYDNLVDYKGGFVVGTRSDDCPLCIVYSDRGYADGRCTDCPLNKSVNCCNDNSSSWKYMSQNGISDDTVTSMIEALKKAIPFA